MSNKDIFISYSSLDREMAIWVKTQLEAHGMTCWMDQTNIPGGADYASEIPDAIEGCNFFVLLLSKEAQESQWVDKELRQAIDWHKTILPFMIENCLLTKKFEFCLKNVQRYAAYEDKFAAIKKMISDIQEQSGVKSDQNTPTEGKTNQSIIGTEQSKTDSAYSDFSNVKSQNTHKSNDRKVGAEKQESDGGRNNHREEKIPQNTAAVKESLPTKAKKKSGKMKMIPIVAGVGGLILALVALVMTLGQSGGGSRGAEQAMQEVLAMLDTPTDTAELASYKATVENFDERLIGSWERDQVEQQGEYRVIDTNSSFFDICILGTGEFYSGQRWGWGRLMEKQIALPVMSVKNGTTNIFEAGKSVYDDGEREKNDIYTVLSSITNLSVTYEITDYKPEQGTAYEEFFKKDTMDYLTIRIQGNYQDGPLAAAVTIDTLFHYKKQAYSSSNWFFPSLEGRWTDNNGYIWAFSTIGKTEEAVGSHGFEVAFAMKDTSGQVYRGEKIYAMWSKGKEALSISISFQDEITVPEYALASYDGMTLELEGEDGSKLVLTRS